MALEIGEAIALGGVIVPIAVALARAEALRVGHRVHAKHEHAINELRDGLGLMLRHLSREDPDFLADIETYAFPLYRDYVAGVPRVNGRSKSPRKRGRR